jgi:glycosyltransferase involved in cell wall biosynthesis
MVGWTGSERVVEQMLELFPRADLVVGVLGHGARSLHSVTRRARETWLASLPLARRHHRWFLPLYPLAFATLDTRGYDLVISSAHAFAKTLRVAERTPHLCYCHSPPRYLWDLESTYRRNAGVAGALLGLAASTLRAVDRASARHVDSFVANSHYIADRIRRCYDREATVVYPPVIGKPATRRAGGRNESLLSLGRLVPYKRVDLAIEAANAMRMPLVVAGDGPERARLERLAGPTVTFLGEVTEEAAGELMETCRAMVFCADEDFGIAPVEANAHGMPVVAYGRGGTLESMRAGETALFFHALTTASLIEAVSLALEHPWQEQTIRANAERFTPDRFQAGLAEQVRRLL